jgi:hypothetical protein
MMVNEPFDVTDDNGITVTGTVDVYRDPNGDYYNRAKPESYMNPRFADVRFNYFNTREACTIDRNALRKAMEDALATAQYQGRGGVVQGSKIELALGTALSGRLHPDLTYASNRLPCLKFPKSSAVRFLLMETGFAREMIARAFVPHP